MPKPEHRLDKFVRTGLLLLLAAVVMKCAWAGDDAFISLRTVENLVEGRGLTWNAGERVQVFTHPLWLLFVTGVRALVPDGYWSLLLASFIATLSAAALVIWGLAGSPARAALAVGALVLSKWWIDFTTSGLENPLLFLLAGLFVLAWRRSDSRGFEASPGGENQVLLLATLTAMAILTRPDSLLLFGPPLAVRAWGLGRQAWRPLLLGMLPLIFWEIFSVVWFGFPVANTAYAKLGTGLPATLLIGQGLRYLAHALQNDPVLGLTLVLGIAAMLRRPRRDLAFLVGLGLYLLYVVWIGGCFMGGRHLTLPFFITVCLLASGPWPNARWGWPVAAVLVLGLLVPRNPIMCPLAYDYRGGVAGIVDERGYYFPHTGAWHRLDGDFEENPWALEGRSARLGAEARNQQGYRLIQNIGFYGYEAGPLIHVLGPYGLGSPFLARLPVTPHPGIESGWRIGHFHRDFPEGFEASVAADRNLLVDPALRRLYDDTQLVTRGPLFSRERWAAIWRLNTSRSPH